MQGSDGEEGRKRMRGDEEEICLSDGRGVEPKQGNQGYPTDLNRGCTAWQWDLDRVCFMTTPEVPGFGNTWLAMDL